MRVIMHEMNEKQRVYIALARVGIDHGPRYWRVDGVYAYILLSQYVKKIQVCWHKYFFML